MKLNEEMAELLVKKSWFKKTNKNLRGLISKNKNLLGCLLKIEDENDIGQVVRMIDFWVKNNIFGVSFEIRQDDNNQIITTEIINWVEGQNPLARGILLVEINDKTKYILLEKKYNIKTFCYEERSFSMIYPDFSGNKLVKLPQYLTKSIPGTTIKKFIDLGYIYPEDSLLGGKTNIFALSITVPDLGQIDKKRISIMEIKDLDENIDIIRDGYLLAIVAKLRSKEII